VVVRSGLEGECADGSPGGLAGDPVDDAAAAAAPEGEGVRPADPLDALDVVQVAVELLPRMVGWSRWPSP
jgi:hypothetical protein